MSYFKAKMHQIRFWPRWGALPDPLTRFKGPTSKGKERREWRRKASRIFSSVCWQP